MRGTISLLCLVFFVFTFVPGLSACEIWEDCGDYPCSLPSYDNDFIASLMRSGDAFAEFGANLKEAVSIVRKHSGVVSDDSELRHMTVQYLCCYSPAEFARIIEIVRTVEWQPFNLTFESVVCNEDHPGRNDSTVSFIVLADAATQQRMAAFVTVVEQTLTQHGIAIHRSRTGQEPFHSTIAKVHSYYPVADVLAELQQTFGAFNSQPMLVDSFSSAFPYWEFKAHATKH